MMQHPLYLSAAILTVFIVIILILYCFGPSFILYIFDVRHFLTLLCCLIQIL